MINSLNRILLIFICLSAAGCVGKNRVTPVSSRLKDSKTYLTKKLVSENSLRLLSGSAKLKISSPEKNLTSKIIFFLKKPGSIHIEILNFFNQPQLFFTTDNKNMQMYLPSENRVYLDKATPENISRLIGVPIDIPDLLSVFSGSLPVISLANFKTKVRQTDNCFIYTIINQSKTEEVWIEINSGRIIKYDSKIKNEKQMEITYSSFKQYGTYTLPELIELFIPAKNYRLSLKMNSLEFTSFSDELFKLTLPLNVEVHSFSEING